MARTTKHEALIHEALETGVIRPDEIVEAAQANDGLGFCVACGAQRDGLESDAKAYQCESCDEFAVFAAEELGLYL